jgi:hypothetical protein
MGGGNPKSPGTAGTSTIEDARASGGCQRKAERRTEYWEGASSVVAVTAGRLCDDAGGELPLRYPPAQASATRLLPGQGNRRQSKANPTPPPNGASS